MNSEKAFWFCIGGIVSVIAVLIVQHSDQLEARNAYQQGTIDNQRLWLESEKRGEMVNGYSISNCRVIWWEFI